MKFPRCGGQLPAVPNPRTWSSSCATSLHSAGANDLYSIHSQVITYNLSLIPKPKACWIFVKHVDDTILIVTNEKWWYGSWMWTPSKKYPWSFFFAWHLRRSGLCAAWVPVTLDLVPSGPAMTTASAQSCLASAADHRLDKKGSFNMLRDDLTC